jgi:phytoene dehydrogenase-like protein
VTSGNIQMGPDPDAVLEALKKALGEDPTLRERPEEEVSTSLADGGYLEQEPDPVLVAEMLAAIDAEGPGEETEAASPT